MKILKMIMIALFLLITVVFAFIACSPETVATVQKTVTSQNTLTPEKIATLKVFEKNIPIVLGYADDPEIKQTQAIQFYAEARDIIQGEVTLECNLISATNKNNLISYLKDPFGNIVAESSTVQQTDFCRGSSQQYPWKLGVIAAVDGYYTLFVYKTPCPTLITGLGKDDQEITFKAHLNITINP